MKLENLDKLLISSFIFCIASFFVLLIYHRLKYYKSNYQKFEYYLTAESKMSGILLLADLIFQSAFYIGFIFLFGYFTSFIIF